MLPADSSGLVAVAVLTAVGSTEVAQVIKGGKPTMKPILGGFLLGGFLLGMASINPQLGDAFAILVIIAALLTNGLTVFTAIHKVTTPTVPIVNNLGTK